MTPDLLNFKKGWMSKLDDSGEWKKHWFVLTDAGLKYYRDSSAEETRDSAHTLSAMTAGIRRNWIEVLKKCIRPSSSPDLTQLPDGSSDKENSHSRFLQSSRRPSSRHADPPSEAPPPAPPTHRRFDYVELSPVPVPPGRERQPRVRAGSTANGKRRGTPAANGRPCSPGRAPARDPIRGYAPRMTSRKRDELLTTNGNTAFSQSANEALQREVVASLRQQLQQLQGGGGGRLGGRGAGVRGGCGPEAPCGRSLLAMDKAHHQALEELQRQHERQVKQLESEKERLLTEETRDTARVMEALKKKHRDELEREVERVKRLGSGGVDSHTLRAQQQSETQALQRELAGLSERYSQKCLEVNRSEQSSAEREREISRKERNMEQLRKENKVRHLYKLMRGRAAEEGEPGETSLQTHEREREREQLRKENQDLKARLAEEMSRTRSSNTSQSSEDRTPCELEVLLRVKENEIEYLHKEISCLRNELQFLNTVL
ncbi:hypothetical protein F7725_003856 [Dissostichus mawsoni]|uniref:PH domain-containing protein n=1 Tax=Dissostichus mawsoni TaxID=36200 RepID=A0A7J5YEQ3_DISMA|nr:hypothetical protein F7725_003856 [Dissostichus mawsoni]